MADKIDRNLFERYGDVQAFGFNAVVEDRSQWYKVGAANNRIVDRTNAYVAAYGMYVLSTLVDAEGRVVSVNDKDASGKPVESESIYGQNFREGRVVPCLHGWPVLDEDAVQAHRGKHGRHTAPVITPAAP